MDDDRTPQENADEATERSLEALADAIIFTLKAGDLGRFQEAKRLCEVGQSLVKARAKRAEDFMKDDPPAVIQNGAPQYNQVGYVLNPTTTVRLATTGGTTNTTNAFPVTYIVGNYG